MTEPPFRLSNGYNGWVPDLPREAVEMSLPVLLLAPNRTKSPALHEITYIGPLYQWLNFEANVKASMPARWSPIVTEHSLRSCGIRQEEVYVADETGLQGRFEKPKLLEGSSGPKAWTFSSITSREIYTIRLGGDQRLRKKGKKHQPSSFSDYLGAQKEHELDTRKWVLENSNVEQGGQRQGVMLLEPHNVTASPLKVNTVRNDLGLRCIV
ncbi:hypothetical protein N7465_004197 [Penicillium sp. CMV-2018d]|nr:hypothetical protein N7465_004197 [Penicillium sp. CMV-2018d]